MSIRPLKFHYTVVAERAARYTHLSFLDKGFWISARCIPAHSEDEGTLLRPKWRKHVLQSSTWIIRQLPPSISLFGEGQRAAKVRDLLAELGVSRSMLGVIDRSMSRPQLGGVLGPCKICQASSTSTHLRVFGHFPSKTVPAIRFRGSRFYTAPSYNRWIKLRV